MSLRFDGWKSALTKIGTNFDKLLSYVFVAPRRLTTQQCADLYNFNALAAKICEIMPEDAMREGVCVKDVKGAESDPIKARLTELNALELVTDAAIWGAVYGKGGVYLGVQDSLTQDQPLDAKRVIKVNFLRAVDRRDISPRTWYRDPLTTKFNTPETYTFNDPGNNPKLTVAVEVHESRFLWFDGVRTSQRDAREQNEGFPFSKLQKLYEQLLRVGVSWENAAQLLAVASQTVMKIDGLRDALVSEGGAEALEKRAQFCDAARNITRSLWIDLNEEVELLSVPFAGIGDILDRQGSMLAASAGLPVTKLFGTQPTGLSATGEADERSWNNRVESYRIQEIKPEIDKLIACLANELNLADELTVHFPSLDRPSEAESADIRLKVAQADHIYMTDRAVLPEEIALSRFAGPEYSMDTQLNPGPREELEFPQDTAAADLAAAKPAPVIGKPGAKFGAKP
jgi:phage-related protein (TIGR01555 family)